MDNNSKPQPYEAVNISNALEIVDYLHDWKHAYYIKLS